MKNQPGAQEFKPGDKVIGKVFLGGTESGTILEFTEGTEGKFAHLTSGKYLHLESLRPASPPAESRAEMPEDVRELLAEARKHDPGAVVSRRGPVWTLVVWSALNPSHNGWCAGESGFSAGDWLANGGRVARSTLAEHIEAGSAWPLADAKKLLAAKDAPVTEPEYECTACGKAMRWVERYQDPARNLYGACRDCYWKDSSGSEGGDAGTSPRVGPLPEAPSEPARHDPYSEHRKEEQPDGDANVTAIRNRAWRSDRIAALSTSASPLDRLAARKQRQRGEVLRDMSRDVRIWKNWRGEVVGFYGKVK